MSSIAFQRQGLLLVVSAPSGGGKSVVLKQLMAAEPGLTYSVSVTTRPPRGDEVDGREYHFVSREQFDRMIREDKFYEWAEVHGQRYGTLIEAVAAALARGADVALDIDVQGGLAVKRRRPDAVLIFLLPPSLETLEQRLRGRATDADDVIRRRLENARGEMEHWRQYDYVVVNRDLEETVRAVAGILRAERLRASRLRPAQP